MLPDGVATVLSVLRSSALVVDRDDRCSRPPRRSTHGLWSATSGSSTELADLVRQVRRDGQIRETELRIRARRPAHRRHVTARVTPLERPAGAGAVEDRTRERRVEAIRRDFVANVSHELKTPVGAIRLLAEAVQEAADDPEAVQRFAGRMSTESTRLTRLVQQIIELSRLQDDDPLDEPRPVDVDAIARAGRSTRAPPTPQPRGSRWSTTASKGLGSSATGSRSRWRVSNLVANAVGLLPRGVDAWWSPPRADETMVDITVTDQGIGIPAAEIDRIFERFYRVDPARHRSTGGTGLGPLDRQARRGLARWRGPGLVRRGPGLDLHPDPAAQAVAPDAPTTRPETTRRQRRDPSARGRGRGELQRRARLHAAQGGVRGGGRRTGPDALTEFDRAGADIVLLDLMLPGLPGHRGVPPDPDRPPTCR